MPQKYRGTFQNRPNTVKIKGDYSGGHPPAVTKQGKILPPSPIGQGERRTQKCFICWARPELLSSRMNHDRHHGSYGRAQRAEDIGHNLAETGHLHDEDFVEDLRAVPSEAWAQALCLIRSYISTARQHTMGAPGSIARVFTGDPAMEPIAQPTLTRRCQIGDNCGNDVCSLIKRTHIAIL